MFVRYFFSVPWKSCVGNGKKRKTENENEEKNIELLK